MSETTTSVKKEQPFDHQIESRKRKFTGISDEDQEDLATETASADSTSTATAPFASDANIAEEEEYLDGHAAEDTGKVTVRAMSNPEVYFMLNDALLYAKQESQGRNATAALAGKVREMERLKDIIHKISPFLASPDRVARANSLKADLEKWSAKVEDGGPPKRLTDRHVAIFTNFKFDHPSEYLELCRNMAERTYFTNDELVDIIEMVNRACED